MLRNLRANGYVASAVKEEVCILSAGGLQPAYKVTFGESKHLCKWGVCAATAHVTVSLCTLLGMQSFDVTSEQA
jgi:hypothetical protein